MWVDQMAPQFRSLADTLNVNYRRFIRTTDLDHQKAVIHVWKKLMDKGDIYLGRHTGWYCQSEEAFYPLRETIIDPISGRRVSQTTGKELTWIEETNYLFRLSKYRDDICKWLQNAAAIVPPQRANDLWQYLEDEDNFRDFSVSRRREAVTWGIPVPGHEEQLIYVWLDALTNYLTVGGLSDGFEDNHVTVPTIQVLGKDILKFHAIYWPALLLALNLPLPHRLIVHGHWLQGGKKISKSVGNVVDPLDLKNKYGLDAVRYYLLKASRLDSDCQFGEDRLVGTVNNELVNQLGNLINRAFTPAFLNTARGHYEQQSATALVEVCNETKMKTIQCYQEYNFSGGLEHAMAILRQANGYFTTLAPWRPNIDTTELAQVLANIRFACKTYADLLYPICPILSGTIKDRLEQDPIESFYNEQVIPRLILKEGS